ncbi:hypothetical protein C486_03944 [Natrinema gari JCM 14663]|uniref:Uncharacterized protein n=2 Tax=Natrialbaceae TaxID=1644061 RepID=L9ZCY6_9EURY|nr:hypothetical protein C486_03944 [Natrinema gari JCM 14663]
MTMDGAGSRVSAPFDGLCGRRDERVRNGATDSNPIPARRPHTAALRLVYSGEPFIARRRVGSCMTRTTYRCPCGARIAFKQDLEKQSGVPTPDWQCKDCGTPVPGITAEKIRHQHPS